MLLLGVLQAQAAGAVGAGSFDLLETQVLTGSAASVTFSSLSTYAADYQHLQLRIMARTTRNSTNDHLKFTFNGASSTAGWHSLYGNGSSVASTGAGNQPPIFAVFSIAAATTTADVFSPAVVDILDAFETTKFKTYRSFSGMASNANMVSLGSGYWPSTNAISSIKIENANEPSNLVTGSRFSLYGIKAGA